MTAAERLVQAVRSGRGTSAADALCRTCVEVLPVDAAAVSLVFDGLSSGTLGSSGERATVLDEVQFTLGQGPCLDAVAGRTPVLVPDLDAVDDTRWPGYRSAMVEHGIRGVFAFPVQIAGEYLATLGLFRGRPGELSADDLATAAVAAHLVVAPVLDVAAADLGTSLDGDTPDWADLNALTRVEVAQATGMLIAQLDLEPVQALARLRAYAYAHGRSTTDVARDVLDRVLRLDRDPLPEGG